MVRIGLAVASVALAGALGACSSDDGDKSEAAEGGSTGSSSSDFAEQPGADIAQAAKDAMADLTSMRVSGEINSDDEEDGTISLDLQVAAGGTCTGAITMGQGGLELLGVDGSTWMRPDADFWSAFAGGAADQVKKAVGDKWVTIPAGEDSFNQFCDLDSLIEQMLDSGDDGDDEGTSYTVTGTEDLDGVAVVAVESEDEDGEASTGFVRVEAPHYLVKIERTTGDDTGSVTFSDFDADVDVSAPAAGETFDLDSLG